MKSYGLYIALALMFAGVLAWLCWLPGSAEVWCSRALMASGLVAVGFLAADEWRWQQRIRREAAHVAARAAAWRAAHERLKHPDPAKDRENFMLLTEP